MDFIASFDVRTIILLVALAFFIQANLLGAQALLIREYRGMTTALLGNLCLTLGFILTILRDVTPDVLSIVVANVFVMLSTSLFYMAVSQFTGQAYNKLWLAVSNFAALFLLLFLTFIKNDLSARIIWLSLLSGANCILIVWQLWQVRNHVSFRISLWLTLIPFLVYGIFLLLRIPATIINPPSSIFGPTPFQILTYLLLFIVSFFWTVGFMLMASQRLQNDLRELATIDTLTRAPNRRATQAFLEKELARAQRNRSQFSVLIIDIDNFKQVNDRHGHAIGDHVLIKSAGMFQASIRKQDLAGRWGGEEFMVVLSGAALSDANALAERLRTQFEKANYDSLHSPVTISIGVATSNGSETIDQLLKRADDALYVAKATKNTVVAASDSP